MGGERQWSQKDMEKTRQWMDKSSAYPSVFFSDITERSVALEDLRSNREPRGAPSAGSTERRESRCSSGTGRNMLVRCSCYAGLLGSLTGFAALSGAVAFAITAATVTTTTTTAAPAGGGRAMGRSDAVLLSGNVDSHRLAWVELLWQGWWGKN